MRAAPAREALAFACASLAPPMTAARVEIVACRFAIFSVYVLLAGQAVGARESLGAHQSLFPDIAMRAAPAREALAGTRTPDASSVV